MRHLKGRLSSSSNLFEIFVGGHKALRSYCRLHRRHASSWPGVRNICAFRHLCLVFSCFREPTAQVGT